MTCFLFWVTVSLIGVMGIDLTLRVCRGPKLIEDQSGNEVFMASNPDPTSETIKKLRMLRKGAIRSRVDAVLCKIPDYIENKIMPQIQKDAENLVLCCDYCVVKVIRFLGDRVNDTGKEKAFSEMEQIMINKVRNELASIMKKKGFGVRFGTRSQRTLVCECCNQSAIVISW